MSKLYTRRGDGFQTSLLSGGQRPKDNNLINAIGSLDSLNSAIGITCSHLRHHIYTNNYNKLYYIIGASTTLPPVYYWLYCYSFITMVIFGPMTTFLLYMLYKKIFNMNVEYQFRKTSYRLASIARTIFKVSSALADPEKRYHNIQSEARKRANVKQLEDWIDELTTLVPELNRFILPTGHIIGSLLHDCRSRTREAERNLAACDDIDDNIKAYINRLSDYMFQTARLINYVTGHFDNWVDPE